MSQNTINLKTTPVAGRGSKLSKSSQGSPPGVTVTGFSPTDQDPEKLPITDRIMESLNHLQILFIQTCLPKKYGGS